MICLAFYSMLHHRMANHTRRVPDMVGKTFTLLTVRQLSHRSNKEYFWFCECACGNTPPKPISSSRLRTGHTKSCGCLRTRSGAAHPHWMGTGAMPGRVWNLIKRCADARDIEFLITPEYAVSLFEQQQHRCALSGVLLKFPERWNDTHDASLDRIDSDLPYQPGNVQWVHKDVNRIKRELTQSTFLAWCKKIAEHTYGR